MSSKAMIGSLKLVIGASTVAGRVMRDHVEISQLQGSIKTCRDFAIASYRACLRAIEKKIKENISSVSNIQVEDVIPFNQGADEVAASGGGFASGSEANQEVGIGASQVEEDGGFDSGTDDRTSFVLTPLSGIELFARGLPGFSIGIGISGASPDGGDRIVSQGVVYDVMDDLFYSATSGMGSYCSRGYDIKLKASAVDRLRNSTVIVDGLDSVMKGKILLTEKDDVFFIRKVQNLMLNVSSCVAMKNAELAIAYLAAGKIDAFICVGGIDLKSIATSLLLARESGVIFLNRACEKINLFGMDERREGFIAITPRMLPEITRFFKS